MGFLQLRVAEHKEVLAGWHPERLWLHKLSVTRLRLQPRADVTTRFSQSRRARREKGPAQGPRLRWVAGSSAPSPAGLHGARPPRPRAGCGVGGGSRPRASDPPACTRDSSEVREGKTARAQAWGRGLGKDAEADGDRRWERIQEVTLDLHLPWPAWLRKERRGVCASKRKPSVKTAAEPGWAGWTPGGHLGAPSSGHRAAPSQPRPAAGHTPNKGTAKTSPLPEAAPPCSLGSCSSGAPSPRLGHQGSPRLSQSFICRAPTSLGSLLGGPFPGRPSFTTTELLIGGLFWLRPCDPANRPQEREAWTLRGLVEAGAGSWTLREFLKSSCGAACVF
ncbi:ADAMTS-like protein 4 [Marmota monax]|uniref:ADAMTS-like protein 4 n=1 Tax=Marmota monax TaxID=9995 RepID=UPI0026F12D71|nr:ADAMTS-like protein 4 [Marmota monax]